MYTQKLILFLCCLAIALPSLACQGNKCYGHYQRKQDVRIGPDQSYKQKQGLRELALAKKTKSEQSLSHKPTSYVSNPYQITDLPMVDLPYAQSHQKASLRPAFTSRSALGTIPVTLFSVLLLANIAHAAEPIKPEFPVCTYNQTLLEGALQPFEAKFDQLKTRLNQYEVTNPAATPAIEKAALTHKSAIVQPVDAKTLGPVKGEVRGFAYELENPKQEKARDFATELRDPFWMLYAGKTEEERVQAINKALEAVPLYYQVSPQKAIDYLKKLTDIYAEELERISSLETYLHKKPSATLLQLLQCTRQLDPALFEEYSKKIFREQLEGFMIVALTNLDTMHILEDSTLSLNNLIEKAFEQALMENGQAAAFGQFLCRGKDLLTKYQDRITATLAPWIKMHPKMQTFLANLIQYGLNSLEDGDINKEEQAQAINKSLEIIPLYYQVNSDKALDYLENFLYRYARRLKGLRLYDSDELDDGLLRCLACAQQVSPAALFKVYSEEILHKKLGGFMLVALAHPDTMSILEGSSLSLSNLIERSFEQALTPKGEVMAFRAFLYKGQALHTEYQDRISAMLLPYIKMHSFSFDIDQIIGLVKSPVQKLRIAAFQALTEAASTVPEPDWWIMKSNLEELFSRDLSGIIDNQSALDAYTYFYQTCIKNNSIKGLQFLWMHLAKSKDLKEVQFLHTTIKEFFNLHTAPSNPKASFEEALNDALAIAIKTKSIPHSQIRKFLTSAEFMMRSMSQVVLEEYMSVHLLQEEAPLEERVQCLNNLRMIHSIRKEAYDATSLEIDSLPDSLFMEYAQTLCSVVSPRQTSYEYFGNRKKLIMLHKKNDALNANPPFIPSFMDRLAPEYYNAFQPNLENPMSQRVAVKNDLIQASLDGELIFGYINFENYYRLYACNSNDGYAVWASPILAEHECKPLGAHQARKPIITDDAIYVFDSKEIIVFDKFNGTIINTISLPVQNVVPYHIHIASDKTLFAIYEDKLCIANQANLWQQLNGNPSITFNTYDLPPKVYGFNQHFINDKLIFNIEEGEKSHFLIYDKHGIQQKFPFESSRVSGYSYRIIQGNQHMIWYVTYEDKNNKKIIFLDSVTGKKLWEYKLPGSLECVPLLSNKQDKLFLLTPQELIALDVSTTQGLPRILWKIPFKGDNDKLWMHSNDDSTLYVISTKGYLFRFDSQTGDGHYWTELGSPANHRLLGIHGDKLYIQS